MKISYLVSAIALAASALCALPAHADTARPPGIITSSGTGAVISAKDLAPGSKVWALWTSMPAGKKVDVPGANAFKWAYLGEVFSGSSVSVGNPLPDQCSVFNASGQQPMPIGQEVVSKPGDATACNYSFPTPYREENRGKEPYVFAYISVGGPGGEGTGDVDTGRIYYDVGSDVKGQDITAELFAPVQKEIVADGAMTLSIRTVTMPTGARTVVSDRYPTLRLVTDGA
jgi:hypothetical protein